MRSTASGQAVCNFGLATNRVWTDRATGQKKEETEFHNIVAWRRLAEIASQYLSKGSLVLVEGRVRTRSWEDSSGNKRYRTEVIARNMQLAPKSLSPSASGSGPSSASMASGPSTPQTPPQQEQDKPAPAKPSDQAPANNRDETIPVIEENGDEEINVEDIPL